MFQRQINNQPAPGVEGAIASSNTPALYVTGPGGLISGALGAIVARFGWASYQADGSERVDNNGLLVANGISRAPSGFIANEQQALTTTYLAEAGMAMLPWQAMELFVRGDFWMKMSVAAASRGQKVFANLLDGTAQPGTAGVIITNFSGTASFATNVMTVVTAPTGTVKVGQSVQGAGIPANTYVASLGTGTGGVGTYNLTTSPGTIATQATTTSDYEESKFRVLSAALTGEIAKIGFGD